ncbi:hypothetical protein HOE22_05195 [Candidatus Woesearchaeota archaeon]|jgi:uncharacterized protein (TIGR02145 family)|nr:hypothetical protein [Candidatus Woesearchaeota archaeon]MBT4852212.1 hypothetical protein [Candidatus Neomarinimicrobiota bacterium]
MMKPIRYILYILIIFIISGCDNSTEPSNNPPVGTDYDGNTYETVQIGEQLWMAENLRVTHYRNGDGISTDFTNSEWTNLGDTEIGAFAVYPWDTDDTSLLFCEEDCSQIYANLYNWYAVDDSRGICPEGFHIPSDEEWTMLTDFLGDNAGSQLAGNSELWFNSEELENNPTFGSSGFNALPGGYRMASYGSYRDIGRNGYFWSSTYFSYYAWSLVISDGRRDSQYDYFQHGGYSVRCLGD